MSETLKLMIQSLEENVDIFYKIIEKDVVYTIMYEDMSIIDFIEIDLYKIGHYLRHTTLTKFDKLLIPDIKNTFDKIWNIHIFYKEMDVRLLNTLNVIVERIEYK